MRAVEGRCITWHPHPAYGHPLPEGEGYILLALIGKSQKNTGRFTQRERVWWGPFQSYTSVRERLHGVPDQVTYPP